MNINALVDRVVTSRRVWTAAGIGALACTAVSGAMIYATSPEAPDVPKQAAQAALAPSPAPESKHTNLANILPAPMFPASVNLQVGEGDTLLTILTDTGVSYEEAHAAVLALRKIYDPRRLDVGQKVAVDLDARDDDPNTPTLKSLSMPISRTAMVELKRTKNGSFNARTIEAPLEKKLVRAGGKIFSSFYKTGLAAGIPADTLADLIRIYSYDVDFQRDIKRGDKLEVLMERLQTKEGVIAGYGGVAFAQLELDNRKIAIYRYEDKNGNVDYYNEKGESLRKALLRTPINGARITSGFGMRMHPLLGYSKMHRGVDFGAAPGTPIYAAGNGIVEIAGWNGGYGNYVRVRHDGKYATAYAHASHIAKGIHPGVRVKQGQVIAYVGSTGMSTGPHLHYEVLVNGQQVNPSGIRFKTGNGLSGKELAAFKKQVSQIRLAMTEGDKREFADAR